MSPLNRGSLMGPRMPSAGARLLPPPRFGIGPPGTPRIPPPPMNPIFGHMPMRNRLPPPSRLPGGVSRPNGMLPLFPGGPRARGMAPIVPPMVPPRASGPPRAPPPRPWFRRTLMPPMPPVHIPYLRRRFNADNGSVKGKPMNNTRKVNKLEDLELKKPWMTDDIRNEVQKKNKLYAKAKKNKNAVEWEEFKDLRNKVTRMIRDAKSEYFTKHPEQAPLYRDEDEENEESSIFSDEDTSCRERVCDGDFPSEETVPEDGDVHTCGIDGCTYTANFLLVEKHMRVEHDKHILVVYQDPKSTNMSTSVVKYMMDRRRKFLQIRKNLETIEPEKVEKKEIKECNQKTRKTINTREKKSKSRKRIRRIREVDNDNVSTVDTYKGLRPFPGIRVEEEDNTCLDIEKEIEQADLCEKVIYNDSDEDVSQIRIPETTNSSVLMLVADYGSDDDEPPEVMPIKKLKTHLQDEKTTKDAVNGETCDEIEEKTSDALQISTPSADVQCSDANTKSNKRSRNDIDKCQDKQKNNKKQNCKGRTTINNRNERNSHKYHNKFLESLLSRDIQHERNLICQCMRYIIDNNFFD